jgi:hypothetical protein
MKFIIDTKYLRDYKIQFDSLLILLSIYFNKPIRVNPLPSDLKDLYTINFATNSPVITQQGKDLVDEIFMKSEFANIKENMSLEELAEGLREIFPKGKKPGTAYMWRDSTAYIVKRLQAFEKKYGKFKYEDVIKATQKYVDSFNGNYGYMQLLKYFIFKDDTSQLLSYLSNLDDEDNNYEDGWETVLK